MLLLIGASLMLATASIACVSNFYSSTANAVVRNLLDFYWLLSIAVFLISISKVLN